MIESHRLTPYGLVDTWKLNDVGVQSRSPWALERPYIGSVQKKDIDNLCGHAELIDSIGDLEFKYRLLWAIVCGDHEGSTEATAGVVCGLCLIEILWAAVRLLDDTIEMP